jgi:hypothetical protein
MLGFSGPIAVSSIPPCWAFAGDVLLHRLQYNCMLLWSKDGTMRTLYININNNITYQRT